jgi:kumamolisin
MKSSFSLNQMVLLGLLLIAIPGAAQRAPLTKHTREAVLSGQAQRVGHPASNQDLRLVFVLPLRNSDELDTLLQELYDPSSANYRKFLTVDEFTERFGPTQQDYDAAIEFAKSNGLEVVGTSRNRLNLDVKGTVAQIEHALHVTMNTYQHPSENRTFYAPDREPSLNLPYQLYRIAGLDNYSIPRPALVKKSASAHSSLVADATTGSGPGSSFLGSDMRAAYYGSGSLTGSGQTLGLFEYLGTDLTDLSTYFSNVGQTNSVPISLVSTDGTSTSCVYASGCDDTEQTLDMTQAIGMAPGLSSLVMYVGSSDASILNAMATASTLNKQLSASWVWEPTSTTANDPYFKEFASQGQSYFQASGDWAEWSSTLNSENRVYPADSPYVTTVGGTDLVTASAGGAWSSETAWAESGGGISPNNFAIPSWQASTAASCSICSKTYRNGPDVAANANYTFYVCADQTTCTENEYGGTSFAAPMWAGYIALANQQAVANGNSTVGFINSALYTIGQGSSYTTDFHDITSGSNGYSATSGFDLVTGWGSPNGASLISALTGSSSGGSQAAAPTYTISTTPSTQQNCGNTVAGYHEPCYLTYTATVTVANGETLYVNGSAVGLTNGTTYTDSVTENWGTAGCSYIPYPYNGTYCFGFATPSSQTAYATESGYTQSNTITITF